MRERLTIEHARRVGESRNGKCLSLHYKTAREKLFWECEKGHIWDATLDNIKRGKWCPVCAKTLRANSNNKLKNRLLQFIKAKTIALNKGGKCLAENPVYANEKMLFECHLGHQWFVSYKYLNKGTWCPYCNRNVQEFIVRSILEYLLDVKIIKYKPKNLLNVKGNRMEFDFWNEKLKFAGEHHGKQHFLTNEFIKTDEELKRRKLDDDIKRNYCKFNNIKYFESVDLNFMRYNTFTDIKPITDYIRKLLFEIGYLTKKGYPDLILKDFYTNTFRLLEMQTIAESKGGECLSKVYVSNYSKLQFKCKNNHIWETSFSHIKREQWCPYCSGRRKTNE